MFVVSIELSMPQNVDVEKVEDDMERIGVLFQTGTVIYGYDCMYEVKGYKRKTTGGELDCKVVVACTEDEQSEKCNHVYELFKMALDTVLPQAKEINQ